MDQAGDEALLRSLGPCLEAVLGGDTWWREATLLQSSSSLTGTHFTHLYNTAAKSKTVLTTRGRGRLLLRQIVSSSLLLKVVCQASRSPSTPPILTASEKGLEVLLSYCCPCCQVLSLAAKVDQVTWRLDQAHLECWLDLGWQAPDTR